MAPSGKSASGKILHNSFWFGLETVLETIIFFGTSVAVARWLGPEKMGHFIYINFFITTVTRTSSTGLAGATRKYMSEFFALDRPGTARAVYKLAYRYQLLAAIALSLTGTALIVFFGDPNYKIMSCILMIAIIPGVMSCVPAEANKAFEDIYPNTISAFGYLLSYGLVIFLTLYFHWDLIGIASATLVGRTCEVLLRTFPVNAKLRKLPLDVLPPDIIHRIRRFCFQSMGLQLMMTVVWDRSEMLFLRYLSTSTEIAYYGISFGLADKLLLFPRTFGAATGITLMVESSREDGRIDGIIKNSCRYLLLVVIPVHLGAAAIAKEALGVVYGAKYPGAAPVLVVAAILAIPRAFQELPTTLLGAADRQNDLIKWVAVTGVVNIVLDALLIPHFGAVGAAWGNGLAQTFGVVAIWQLARGSYQFSFPIATAVRLSIAGLIMAVAAFFVGRSLPQLPGLIAAILVATPVYLIMVKLLHGMEASDRSRLSPIGKRLPGSLAPAYTAAINFITPRAI